MAAIDLSSDRERTRAEGASLPGTGKDRGPGLLAPAGKPFLWLMAAAAGAALWIAVVLALLIPALAHAAGPKLLFLVVLSGLATASCACVAATLQFAEAARLGRALMRERADVIRADDVSQDHLLALDASFEGFSKALLIEHPLRVAAGLEVVSRTLDSQTEATRKQLQAAAEATAEAMDAQASAFANRLGEEQDKLTQALGLYGESLGARLKLVSVSLVREFRDTAEEMQKGVETVGEAAIANLESQGRKMTEGLEGSLETLERRIEDRSREISSRMESACATAGDAFEGRSAALVRQVSQTMQEVCATASESLAAGIDEADTARRGLLSAVEEGASALTEKVAKAARTVEITLRGATATIERQVEAALTRIETTLEARLERFEARLLAVDGQLNQEGVRRGEALAADIGAATSAMKSAVSGVAAETARLVAEEASRIKDAFAEGARLALQDWLTSAQAAASQLESASTRAGETIGGLDAQVNERLSALGAQFAARAETLTESLKAQSRDLGAAFEGAAALMAKRSDNLKQTLDASAHDLDATTAWHVAELEARFGSWRSGWEEARRAEASFWTERAEADRARLEGIAERHRDAVVQALAGHRSAIEASFAAALPALEQEAAQREQQTGARLEAVARAFVNGLVGEMRAVGEALGAQGQQLGEDFAVRRREMIDALGAALLGAERQAADRLGAILDTLDGFVSRLDIGLEARGHAIAETLDGATSAIAKSFGDGWRETASAIEATSNAALHRLQASRTALLEEVARTAHESAEAVSSGLERHREAVDLSAEGAVKRLEAARAALDQSVSQTAMGALRVICDRIAETRSALEDSSRVAAAHLEEGRRRLIADLGADVDRAAERLEVSRAEGAAAAERLAAEFALHRSGLEQTVERALTQIRSEWGAPLQETLRRLEADGAELAAATRTLAESVSATSADARTRLQETFAREADALAAAIASGAETFRRHFETLVAGSDDVFLARGMELAQTLVGRFAELRALLASGEGLGLLSALDVSSARLAQQVETASQRSLGEFERKATALIGLLTRRGDDLLSAMSAAASESARKVQGLAEEVDAGADRVAATMREIERKLGAMPAFAEKRGDNIAQLNAPRASAGSNDPPTVRAALALGSASDVAAATATEAQPSQGLR